MKNILLINKKEGETPLEALLNFRCKYKQYKDIPMTYAGRLDPLVSGLLLVLAGDSRFDKEKYLGFSKEYSFSVLFGFATDTYDILGKIVNSNNQVITKNELEKNIKQNLKFFTGKFIQKYPMYSSRTVKGKPLFAYARAGEAMESPEREVWVKNLKFLKIKKISKKKLLENIERRVSKVQGDFRQKEILKIWMKELSSRKKSKEGFFTATFYIKCGSGTYVRAVANDLGGRIGLPSLALVIKRTRIGRYSLENTTKSSKI